MDKIERRILLVVAVLIAISLFLMSFRGRYQYLNGVSHDTWTGKVYLLGTKFIEKSKKETEARRQQENNIISEKNEPNPFDQI